MTDTEGTASGSGWAAGWYVDPEGRFEQRYYDGTNWTREVVHNGVTGTDTGAPARPSPVVPGMVVAAPRASERPPARKHKNLVGPGLFIALGGWGIVLLSLAQPWLGTATLWRLTDVSREVQPELWMLDAQVLFAATWLLIIVACTTLPFQPNKLFGFLMGGLIGLLVCWRTISNDDRSIRSNLYGLVFIVLQGTLVWVRLDMARGSQLVLRLADLGRGPYLFTLGLGVAALGVMIGRRYRLVDLPSVPTS